ncbi:type II toxin-antitoxin system PemK/MazF family toxin [Kaistella jeonii]|nr:type II toxin-antitoxin system PemK/MazF family toxin [Kaistella jeonii]SFC35166.1 mRNA interferase MazF [Kaistella jeonii]VEI95351.1 PemK-like protein [Kaistella jeonii]
MNKGDIVLIPFPFTDLSGNKLRPAVILFSKESDIMVCFITSNMKWRDFSDIEIKKTEANGLKVDSVLKVSKIATLDKYLLVGKLGILNSSEIAEMNKILENLLKLK